MKASFKTLTIRLLCVTWAVTCLLTISILSLEHFVVFQPNQALAVGTSGQQWSLTHVLGTGCKCSDVVAGHLLKRGARSDVRESVVIIGSDTLLKLALVDRGFSVQEKNEKGLDESISATGVPFLIVADGDSRVRYSGGYGDHKIVRGSPIRDLDILQDLQSGRKADKYPIFGCATSLKYQSLLDPFKVKYRNSRSQQ